MFDHVTIRVADREASLRFYDTVLGALGRRRTHTSDEFVEWDDFGLAAATAAIPPTAGLHVAFAAGSRAEVDAFWRAGVDAGYADDGAPGPRPQYSESYYGGFLLDPDGNSAEAVHHDRLRRDGAVDHLWIRVADLAAAERFYALAGEHAGFRRVGGGDDPPRARFSGGNGSFSVVAGPPTRNLHVAFPAATGAAVAAFHARLVAAGYRDNGGPGERPQYHAGYYAAFVLDPDGTNVELVDHDRG